MRTTFILLFIVSLSATAVGQNLVANGDFENWTTAIAQQPQYSFQTSNPGIFYSGGTTLNCVRTADGYHGNYAITLATIVVAPGDTEPGYYVNGNANNNPSSWTGGIPISESPTGITGFYKSNITGGDSALIILSFRKSGSNIGVYYAKLAGIHTGYTRFSVAFNPPLPDTPDSVVIGAISSDLIDNVAIKGSIIQLDSLSFTGVTAQPSEMNGDFELWQNDTLTKPDNWRASSLNQQKGVKQTTNSYGGNYAIELTTLLGDNNGTPWAFPSGVTHSSPFTGLIDTLVFYYKYTAHGGDNGLVKLDFNKQGVSIGGALANLGITSSYLRIQIPVDLDVQPDTAVIQFQSSLNEDTSASYVGSVLKVDSVYFKSQKPMVGVKNYTPESSLFIYPNPSGNGVFIVNGTEPASQIWVYDMLGKEVKATVIKSQSSTLVKMPANTTGIYLVRVMSGDKIYTSKLMVNR